MEPASETRVPRSEPPRCLEKRLRSQELCILNSDTLCRNNHPVGRNIRESLGSRWRFESSSATTLKGCDGGAPTPCKQTDHSEPLRYVDSRDSSARGSWELRSWLGGQLRCRGNDANDVQTGRDSCRSRLSSGRSAPQIWAGHTRAEGYASGYRLRRSPRMLMTSAAWPSSAGRLATVAR